MTDEILNDCGHLDTWKVDGSGEKSWVYFRFYTRGGRGYPYPSGFWSRGEIGFMGIRFAEVSKLRTHKWKRDKQKADKLGIKSLGKQLLIKRRNELNESKFKSEMWFKNKLSNKFKNHEQDILVHRNFSILNKFFADFYFFEKNIAVEIDGSSHDGKEGYDSWRDSIFEKAGIKIFRLKAFDENKCEILLNKLDELFKIKIKFIPIFIPTKKQYDRKQKKLKAQLKAQHKEIKKQIRAKKFAQQQYIETRRQNEHLWALGKGSSPYIK